jgi:diguanylate cyclase
MKTRIRTKREVLALTALLTAVTVLIPTIIAAMALGFSPGGFTASYATPILIIAFFIPLFLTPPIAYAILNLIRVQADMIRTVDARIKFDMLTGVFNRNHFLDGIRASQTNGPIMIVDADHFKAINDTYGHASGDEVLRILANVIQQCVGADGIVGRLGGEEFGIFMPGISEMEGFAKATAICEAVRNLHPFIGGRQINLTVSIGCSYHRATKVIGHSLKIADDLLYRAKAEGRDRVAHDRNDPGSPQSVNKLSKKSSGF